jgi:hypothetical protein
LAKFVEASTRGLTVRQGVTILTTDTAIMSNDVAVAASDEEEKDDDDQGMDNEDNDNEVDADMMDVTTVPDNDLYMHSTYYRQTRSRRGRVLKTVEERYLRDDLGFGCYFVDNDNDHDAGSTNLPSNTSKKRSGARLSVVSTWTRYWAGPGPLKAYRVCCCS